MLVVFSRVCSLSALKFDVSSFYVKIDVLVDAIIIHVGRVGRGRSVMGRSRSIGGLTYGGGAKRLAFFVQINFSGEHVARRAGGS